jgi:hypothetical protein
MDFLLAIMTVIIISVVLIIQSIEIFNLNKRIKEYENNN